MTTSRMSWALARLLILVTLGRGSRAERGDDALSCPESQRAFGSSCFEFVGLQLSFAGAQARCEQGGGHLAFITDEDTQNFLQRHLDPEADVWFGVASSAEQSGRNSPTDGGLLAWLDGSPVSYSKWVGSPPPGSACGHIRRNSGFQWEATRDCGKRLHFICQFESGRFVVCADSKPTLRCGPGQVIMIDRSFYGRGNPHYCRPAASAQQEWCGWTDVRESVAAHCNGRRLCQTADLMSSFGGRCAGSGAYLSVDSHCEDGLTLSVNPVAAVFDRVPIRVKLLAPSAEGSFSCKLSTGDGRVVFLHGPHEIEQSMSHMYTLASAFIVAVECVIGETQSSARKMITVQEPVTEIGAIRCFAGNVSSSESNCKALHGSALHIQTEVKAGTNVTYRVQRGEQLLSGLSVLRGNVPQNITVPPEELELLGTGCHRLVLYASNMVTVPEVSTDLQVCVMEEIAGLHASVLTDMSDCSIPHDFSIGVSLGRGAPVQLLFSLVGDNSSFSETKTMATSKGVFNLRYPAQGAVQVKVRAWNDFSSLDRDVDISGSCGKNSVLQVKSPYGHDLGFHSKTSAQHVRVARSPIELTAMPSFAPGGTVKNIELTVLHPSQLTSGNGHYAWYCNDCQCNQRQNGIKGTVSGSCLPDPFEYIKYYFENRKESSLLGSICITITPVYSELLISLTCFMGCDPVKDSTDAKIKMDCNGCHNNVIWGIQDPKDESEWENLQPETKSCYTQNRTRPLIAKQENTNEYTVKHDILALAKSKEQDITVVLIRKANMLFTTFTIKTSSSSPPPSHPAQTTAAASLVTPANPEVTVAFTKTTPAPTVAPLASSQSTAASKVPPASTTEAMTVTAATKSTAAPTNAAPSTTDATAVATTEATAASTKASLTTTESIPTPITEATLATTKTTNSITEATLATTKATNSITEATLATTKTTNSITEATLATTKTTNSITEATLTTTKTTNSITEATDAIPVTTRITSPITEATSATQQATSANTKTTLATTRTGVTSTTSAVEATTAASKATADSTSIPATATRTTIHGSTNVRSAATTVLDVCNVGFSCTISPTSGTVLVKFTLSCQTNSPCINCQYCFATYGLLQRCSDLNTFEYVYLPVSGPTFALDVEATATDGSCADSAIATATVLDDIGGNSAVQNLQRYVDEAVNGLDSLNQLSGQSVAQLFFTSASKINYPFDPTVEVEERTKLREGMLFELIDLFEKVPITNHYEAFVIAKAVSPMVLRDIELSWAAQLGAASLLFNISRSLLTMGLPDTMANDLYIYQAGDYLTLSVYYMFAYSVDSIIVHLLIDTLYNVLSALLRCAAINDPPIVIHQGGISLYARRVSIDVLISEPMVIPGCTCAGFSLTSQPASVFPAVTSVHERVISLDLNPYPYHDDADITSVIGGLSLTKEAGDEITLKNLKNDIEIFLPRPANEKPNSTALYLGNFSTTIINVTSDNETLMIQMVPSEDLLPFRVFLQYQQDPTTTSNIARTVMPRPGTTLNEKYTWKIDPELLEGKLGTYYLVVNPIVGPTVQSVNATLFIATFGASCKFWNESRLNWTIDGCQVGPKSTAAVTHCLCNHLTFFGSSFFVTPNVVDPSRTVELFHTVAENPVVVSLVGALFGGYLVVVIWARWKDIRDTAKVKVTVLKDNSPMDQYRYLLSISTGHRIGASTSSQVTLTLLGADGSSEPHHLTDPEKVVFERGAVDLFLLCTPFSLGELEGVRLWHSNSGWHPAWFVGTVSVQDLQTKQKWHFLCNSWLSVDMDDCTLDKVFPTASGDDLKRFSNLFFMRTSKDFNDGHLWFSVANRPAGSNFTCVQRVSCCFSLLLCTMLTSIMFYGIPTDPSEEALDLGHFEFTWQQLMVGMQSSLIVFPVNILIVSVFRNARPRQMSCCQRKSGKEAREQEDKSQGASTNASLDDIIKEVTRIAELLSQSVKSNVPSTQSEFGPGQQNDINAVLSVLEDFIRQHNRAADSSQSKTQQQQQPESSSDAAAVAPGEAMEKKSNKTQYLYKQLCHTEKELSQLGPSAFPSTQSHSQALQQVQSMKGFLDEQLCKPGRIDVEGNSPKKSDQSDSSDEEESPRKGHGGLPWWFMFVGWLLVLASSVIAGFFTMLYGLQFGRQRSLSWLISMSVSFFQSLLLIQPIKVLCLALFFALVIKKVDEDSFQNVPKFDSEPVNPGDVVDLRALRSSSSVYVPPPAGDIERMKRNKMLEKKAFALLWEILTYLGFMWMLLLVAYGQRDANAFLLNKHIRKSFARNASGSMSLGDVFTWANTTLLSNLFGDYPGFITDGNSKLVGNARLRQLRVQGSSCQSSALMQELAPARRLPYSWDAEDTSSYAPGWSHPVPHDCAMPADPWTYQSQARLRSYPTWGSLVLYRGGGYVAELGPDIENASSTLKYLFSNKWLDAHTRAIFVEFTVYNANVNLFCIVTLLLETAAVGAFLLRTELQSIRLYQSTGGLHIFVMAAEIIYLLFIVYYMVVQGKLMRRQRWAYFKSKWNLLDLTIILLSWSAVAVFTMRTLLGNRDISYYQSHKDEFASFYETASADAALRYLIAFVVLLATIKLWHLLRLHPKMNMISATLQRAWSDISGFLLVIGIMLVAYSITTNVIYGWKLSSYRTLADAILTIVSLQMGMFNYGEVLDNTSLLGWFVFGSCIIFMTFVVVNLLISVILVAFTEEQKHHKPSEEEEVVDMMLTKICSLFGVSFKGAQEKPGPDASSSGDSNTPTASEEDVNTLHPTAK